MFSVEFITQTWTGLVALVGTLVTALCILFMRFVNANTKVLIHEQLNKFMDVVKKVVGMEVSQIKADLEVVKNSQNEMKKTTDEIKIDVSNIKKTTNNINKTTNEVKCLVCNMKKCTCSSKEVKKNEA